MQKKVWKMTVKSSAKTTKCLAVSKFCVLLSLATFHV